MAHQNFEGSDLKTYLTQYAATLHESLKKIDTAALSLALSKIKEAKVGGHQIFVAGNGGSAAISDHLCCDFSKGTFVQGEQLRTQSLSANSSLLTAIGNDLGFDEVFSHQLKILAKKNDVLILISSSGNSPNILKAAKLAKELGVTTIGLTGFTGGSVAELLDVHIHIAINNYGVVEDSHQAIMHILSQFINHERDKLRHV